MREIKFRAWETYSKQGKMVEVKSLQFHDWLNKDGEDGANGVHFHLMQYTGLKDKKGMEIYEGDIIASIENPDIWQSIVYFEFGSFRVRDVKGRIGGQYIMYGDLYDLVGDEGNDYEVIGNIYENPERLEGGLQQ